VTRPPLRPDRAQEHVREGACDLIEREVVGRFVRISQRHPVPKVTFLSHRLHPQHFKIPTNADGRDAVRHVVQPLEIERVRSRRERERPKIAADVDDQVVARRIRHGLLLHVQRHDLPRRDLVTVPRDLVARGCVLQRPVVHRPRDRDDRVDLPRAVVHARQGGRARRAAQRERTAEGQRQRVRHGKRAGLNACSPVGVPRLPGVQRGREPFPDRIVERDLARPLDLKRVVRVGRAQFVASREPSVLQLVDVPVVAPQTQLQWAVQGAEHLHVRHPAVPILVAVARLEEHVWRSPSGFPPSGMARASSSAGRAASPGH